MTEQASADVLIVGAGPTGMVAAIALSRSGITSIVLDRLPAVSAHPKAHELSPRSIEILTSLGVPFAALEAEASPYDDSARVVFCGRFAEELGTLDLHAGGADAKYFRAVRAPKPFLNVSQSAIETVLRDELSRCPGVTLKLGYNFRSLTDREGEPVVSQAIAADSSKPPIEVRTKYVLCADGAGSTSRRALGIAMDGPESLQDFVNAYIEHDLAPYLPTRAKLFFSFDPTSAGTFVAHHVEKRWVYHRPIFPPYEKVEEFGAPELLRCIEHAVGQKVEGLRVRSIESWRMTAQIAERFRKGRAFLIGDAAHRFPPTGGLGMNSGIADAHNLAWKVAAVLRGQAEPTLLDTYESERRPVIARNCTESEENFKRISELLAVLGIPADGALRAAQLRHTLLRFLPRRFVATLVSVVFFFLQRTLRRASASEPVRAAFASALQAQIGHFDRLGLDLGASYASGAVVADGAPPVPTSVTDYVPTTRPGSRLPHVWLDDEKSKSTHDLLDSSQFTLLVGPAAASWTAAGHALSLAVRALSKSAELEIEPSGALLIRPDGYVAWRSREGALDPAVTLESAMRSFGWKAST